MNDDLGDLENVDFEELWALCDFEELWAFCKKYEPVNKIMPLSLFHYMYDNVIHNVVVDRNNAYQEAVSEYYELKNLSSGLVINYGFLVFRHIGFLK